MTKATMVHFTITGEFITQQARSFWAEEDEPERALNLLKCMRGISDCQIMDVLEGRSKLTGDSNTGVTLEPDNKKLLTMQEVIGKLKRERDEALDDRADAVQMLNNDTEGVASPGGLRIVPRRKTTRSNFRGVAALAKGYDWDDADPLVKEPGSRQPRFFRESEHQPARRKTRSDEIEEERPEPKKVPLEPDLKITNDTGWLSPEGKFYGCSYGQHNFIASRLDLKPWEMDDSGWIRAVVVDEEPTWFVKNHDEGGPTGAQRLAITAYCQEKGLELPWWLGGKDEG